MRGGAGRRLRAGALLGGALLVLTACSGEPERLERTASGQQAPTASSPASASPGATATGAPSDYAVPDPGHLRGALLTPDVLVTSTRTIPASVRRAVRAVRGVRVAMPMSLASLSVDGRTLSVAAADPGQFRRFTPYATAQSDAVWSRVADGEIAVDPSLPSALADAQGYLTLGAGTGAPRVHVGAYAPLMRQAGSTLPPVSGVVDDLRGAQLGLPSDNALLVSTGTGSPSAVTARLRRVLGAGTTLATLAVEFRAATAQTAVLSGTSVSDAVGSFSYTPHPDGTVTPDPAWVREYIRREDMPIIGEVTGNKGMLPQLRAALDEVVRSGLADKIHPAEYGGCYVPRFIAKDPGQGLSLHSWGIAVDLNVPGNLRGTVGQMDRRVVAIFARWGFAWGGSWRYTDPMHFELAKVVPVP